MPKEQDPKEPLALPCYEAMADEYAASVDTKPYNAHYERPAVLSLLPPVAGLRVLDAGCGSGWYSEHLLAEGAEVTAFDVSPNLVAITQTRLGDSVRVLQADLGQPLDFLETSTFDLALCSLVMHYLKDWEPVFAEFLRVLKEDGTLLFSTHHPFMDFRLFEVESYFGTELLEDEWSTGKVRFYRRSLTSMLDALRRSGFALDRLLEPLPTEDFRRLDPEGYEKLTRNPWFLVIRARPARKG